MVGHGGSSAGSYLADHTSPIPSHYASVVVTSTLRVKKFWISYSYHIHVKYSCILTEHTLSKISKAYLNFSYFIGLSLQVLIISVILLKTCLRQVQKGESLDTSRLYPTSMLSISVSLLHIHCLGKLEYTMCPGMCVSPY